MSDLKLAVNKNRVKNSISFNMTEDDDPNEIAVLYYSFGFLRQSLKQSLQHIVGQEKVNVEYYIKILDRWINELESFMKKSEVLASPLVMR